MQGSVDKIPWKLLLSRKEVWAIILSHFCHNWGVFILLTWMPSYYASVLGFDLASAGLAAVYPWLCMAIMANVGGWIADSMISKGVSRTAVRKVMQTLGFLGPAFFLTQLQHVSSPMMAILCMCACQGFDAFSQSGLYSNHQVRCNTLWLVTITHPPLRIPAFFSTGSLLVESLSSHAELGAAEQSCWECRQIRTQHDMVRLNT